MKKIKKLLLGIITIAAMAVLCAVCAGAETYGNYKYSVLDDGTVKITDYTGSATTLSIPAKINGKRVTSIGRMAFYGCSGLTSITIPKGVTSIGAWAFEDCSGLTSITIPDSVTSIGGGSFSHCSGLAAIKVSENNKYYISDNGILFNKNKSELICYPAGKTGKSYSIPDSVTSIGNSAFSYCSALTSITIPDSVTSIGNNVFLSCSGLTSITIPDGVTSIGFYAFEDCSGLKSITIPKGVTSIGNGAFSYCSSLTSITIPDGVTSIGSGAFGGTPLLDEQNTTVKYVGKWAVYCDYDAESAVIKSGTVGIADDAFSYRSGLASITIPGSVTSIGAGAFWSCSGLTSITIPDSVTSIGDRAFSSCTGLASITIPDSVTSIGDYALGYTRNTDSWEFEKIPGFKIYCYTGTAGEAYAKENGFEYELLGAKPTAVTGLTVGASTSTSLSLNWTKNDSATGYLIQQYKDGEWKHIRQLARNTATTYTATGLAPSTTYQYRVRAYYTDGSTITYSDYTTISGTTNPANITGVKVSSTANSVTISWDKNNSATGYFVQQYKNGAWTHVRQLARNTATTFTASGLTPSAKYQYRIRAYYTDGTSTTYSDYKYVSPTTRPTNLTGVKVTSTINTVTLSWDKNNSATGYFVQQYKNGAWTHVRQLARNTATT